MNSLYSVDSLVCELRKRSICLNDYGTILMSIWIRERSKWLWYDLHGSWNNSYAYKDYGTIPMDYGTIQMDYGTIYIDYGSTLMTIGIMVQSICYYGLWHDLYLNRGYGMI